MLWGIFVSRGVFLCGGVFCRGSLSELRNFFCCRLFTLCVLGLFSGRRFRYCFCTGGVIKRCAFLINHLTRGAHGILITFPGCREGFGLTVCIRLFRLCIGGRFIRRLSGFCVFCRGISGRFHGFGVGGFRRLICLGNLRWSGLLSGFRCLYGVDGPMGRICFCNRDQLGIRRNRIVSQIDHIHGPERLDGLCVLSL